MSYRVGGCRENSCSKIASRAKCPCTEFYMNVCAFTCKNPITCLDCTAEWSEVGEAVRESGTQVCRSLKHVAMVANY